MMSHSRLRLPLLVAVACLLASPLPGLAQSAGTANQSDVPMWISVGMGGGSVQSLAPAPSAGRSIFAASIEMGYRVHRDWGLGLELGAILPFEGCAQWECGSRPVDFAPNFSRFAGFAEYRPGRTGLRLRAGLGMSRFCYRSHWSEDAWSWLDTLSVALFADEMYVDGSGARLCDASRRALGGTLSVGYDWPLERVPATWGLRLTAEAANYDGKPSVGMAPFRHRALFLTLHLTLQ